MFFEGRAMLKSFSFGSLKPDADVRELTTTETTMQSWWEAAKHSGNSAAEWAEAYTYTILRLVAGRAEDPRDVAEYENNRTREIYFYRDGRAAAMKDFSEADPRYLTNWTKYLSTWQQIIANKNTAEFPICPRIDAPPGADHAAELIDTPFGLWQ